MLNKAEIPVRRFDDLLKQLQPVVEGKSMKRIFPWAFNFSIFSMRPKGMTFSFQPRCMIMWIW